KGSSSASAAAAASASVAGAAVRHRAPFLAAAIKRSPRDIYRTATRPPEPLTSSPPGDPDLARLFVGLARSIRSVRVRPGDLKSR
ncbi:Os05g0317300, partial [Oryza sativa Japonica Group]